MDRDPRIEKSIAASFTKHFDRVQVPLRDLPKIIETVRVKHAKTGENIDSIVESLAYQYKTFNEQKAIFERLNK